jgi:hypothetical protein
MTYRHNYREVKFYLGPSFIYKSGTPLQATTRVI